MKYIKIIFIFFISLNVSAFCANLAEPTSTTEIQKNMPPIETNEQTSVIVTPSIESNELRDWNDHLKKLETKGDNWVTDNNIPTDSWTTQAFNLAEKAMATNDTLSEELKSSFSAAIKAKITQEGGAITVSPEILMEKFDKKIEELKKQTTPEPIIEKKEEQKAVATILTPEKSALQPDQAVTAAIPPITETPSPADTISRTPVESAQPEFAKIEAPQETKTEEKKENLIQDWNNCLQYMQSSKGDIYELINKAIELAQKLQSSQQMTPTKLISAFTKALEGATVVRKLSPYYKDDSLSKFASTLGIYIPTPATPIAQFQPSPAELAMKEQQANIVEIQRKQIEQEERIRAEEERYNREMIKQQALRLEAEKRQLTESQLHTLALNRMQAEQKKAAEDLQELHNKERALTLKLEAAIAQQKTAPEKSLFTRVKETVSGLFGGSSSSIESTEESMIENQQQLEKVQKQISQEKEKQFELIRHKADQVKKTEELKTLTGHKLTKIEQARKAQLEAEQREIARITDIKNLEAQKQDWPAFMNYIRTMEQMNQRTVTPQDNDQATQQAVEKAILMIKTASRIPATDLQHLMRTLKITFINALLDQQRGKQNQLNTVPNQTRFDNAIDDIVVELEKIKGQLYKRLTQ